MGYLTRFEVSADGFESEEMAEFFAFKLERNNDYGFSPLILGCSLLFETDEIKWYNWDQQLTDLSKSFPGVTIRVEGHGEEQGDIWRARIRDGKKEIVHAELIFPEFVEIT